MSSEVLQVVEAVSDEGTRKGVFDLLVKWGFGAAVAIAAIWKLAGWVESKDALIVGQLLELNKNQAAVIAQNGQQLVQNSDVMKANQACLEACTESHKEVVRALERLGRGQ